MMNHKESIIEKGIVLSVSNYLDDSAISSVITNNGIYQVIIRHGYKIKSDLKNLLIPFNYVDLELKNNKDKLFNATYCKVIKDYSNGFNNYAKNLFLQCIIQLTLSLFHLEDKFNIEYLIDILDKFNDDGDLLSLLILLIGNYYKLLGITKETNKCVLCNKKNDIVSYSLKQGGFLCKECAIKNHKSIKPKNELYVFKYVFKDINNETLNKIVPKDEGIKILTKLTKHLEDYFGISKLSSINNFILFLINEK